MKHYHVSPGSPGGYLQPKIDDMVKKANEGPEQPAEELQDAPSFVTIACKLPHGLQIDVKGVSLTLRGSNSPGAIGGYGFTQVREDYWQAWLAAHRTYTPVQKGLIFAHPKAQSAKAKATEQAEIKNGLEPLNSEKPIPGIKPVTKPQAGAGSIKDGDDEPVV